MKIFYVFNMENMLLIFILSVTEIYIYTNYVPWAQLFKHFSILKILTQMWHTLSVVVEIFIMVGVIIDISYPKAL